MASGDIEINVKVAPGFVGAQLIADERERQVEVEGWTAEHDDTRSNCELLDAAICYAGMTGSQLLDPDGGAEARIALMEIWPFDPTWWKPSDDPVRNLVKAGAFIAAEIDRITRTRGHEIAK